MFRSIATAALVLIFSLTLAAAAEPVPTVGDFLVQVAQAAGFQVADAAAAEAALRGAGATLPVLDPGAPLTEAAVAAIGTALGLPVTTSDPGAGFDASRVGQFLGVFGGELRAFGQGGSSESGEESHDQGKRGPYPRPNDNAADPLERGKGKKNGLKRSPSDFD